MSRLHSKVTTGLVLLSLWLSAAAWAEDGYQLWLRYHPLPAGDRLRLTPHAVAVVVAGPDSETSRAAVAELRRGLSGLLGRDVATAPEARPGAIVLATPDLLPALGGLNLPMAKLGNEGFLIRPASLDGKAVTLIAANSDIGLLHGAFALLRHLQAGTDPWQLDVTEAPRVALRLLNHWDNLDRTVERGYAGESIWDWWRLPDFRDPRYVDYARANASIGINGTVLNNVNASATILSQRYIARAAALADVLRPYGIRVYLSIRFSSPIELGGLKTADPLDAGVRAWWRDRVDEIYRAIPDFGGFLVKANSEGQPGPQDYGRTHADGANMLAAALAPHGGVVLWRAFVYSPADTEDRVKQAYKEFRPLDGQFARNVIVQVKNGPLDFQPREPFHPLFGKMPNSSLAMEFQITQEYLGFSTHLAYLGTMWEEVLRSDTYVAGPGSTVARIIDGSLQSPALTAMSGVSNIGSDRDWTGAPFTQANWYAFGRLAWDPELDAAGIAEEWLKMTFSTDPDFVAAAADMMMRSREAVVDYMTPLGLAHLMGTGHHYGPAPWVDDLDRPEWNPWYYHRADREAIGLDRTASGSDALSQYAPELALRWGSLETVPERYLLWFHRVPWDYRLRSGKTLWEELVAHYDHGVGEVEKMQATWDTLARFVDTDRFEKTRRFLAVQRREAQWWRDACLAYFMERSGRALPDGVRPPEHSLAYYRSLRFPYAPGN